MLNFKAEWFGHLAIQVMICTAWVGVLQASDGLALPPGNAAVSQPSSRPLSTAPSAAKGLTTQLKDVAAQKPGRSPFDATPLLLAQAGPYSQKMAGVNPPPRKPVNETARPAVGATPSGNSVKPGRYHPKIQSADDPTDPYIIAESAALNNDPNQIFAFVRDQVGFQVYSGSLRGARGTLWSMAGNSLDKSSLLIALLGAAGVSAKYVQGTISSALQQQLILSMFPNQYQLTGCPPVNGALANPAADPTLLADLSNHFWVEFGPTNTPADPSFPTDQIGTVPGTLTTTFTAIPAALQHTVTFRVDIEQYEQAEALFGGSGISTTEVLNQTFATTDLIGVPVTVGNFVGGSSFGAVLSETTFTYSPYLRLGTDLSQPNSDQIIQGQSYQEIFTNFPLGNEALTGVFVNIDVNDPGVATQTYQRSMLDRIGYAARQGDVSVQVQLPSTPAPALQAFSLQTYLVNASAIAASVATALSTLANAQDQVAANFAQQTQAISATTQDPAQLALLQQATQVSALQFIIQQRIGLVGFEANSATDTAAAANAMLIAAYENSPRLLDFDSTVTTDGSGNPVGIQLAMDLRRDSIRAIPSPIQQASASAAFQGARGLFESSLESALINQVSTSLSGTTLSIETGAIAILGAAQSQGISIEALTLASIGQLSSLNISADAAARITTALAAGKTVYAPAAQPSVNGQPAYAWLEQDPNTGEIIDSLPDGGHEDITEFTFTSLIVGFGIGFVLGLVEGLLEKNYPLSAGILPGFALGAIGLGLFSALEVPFLIIVIAVALLIFSALFLIPKARRGEFLTGGGPESARFALRTHTTAATPGAQSLPTALPPFLFNLPTSVAPVIGATPASALESVSSNFVLPDQGVNLPLVFSDSIAPGAAASYTLLATNPVGFQTVTSVGALRIPGGQTGSVGVCLVPTGTLPAPGTVENFSVTATDSANPSLNTVATESFTVPAIQAVTIQATPTSLTTTPGQPVMATLQLQSIGNVAATATLTSTASSGLAVSGLGTSVPLGVGQNVMETLTLTPSAQTPVGTSLFFTITSTSGNMSNPQVMSVTINLTVAAAQAQNAVQASQSASSLGRTDIASTLSGLSGAIDTALSNCGAASEQSVVDYVTNLIQEMNAPFLSSFVSQLQSAVTAIAGASCTTIGAALTQLSGILSSLNTVLQSPVAFPFNFTLIPNTATAIPGAASTFLVGLQNNSSATNTYNLSLGSLPGGVNGSISTASVTLGPGQSVPVNNAMNNPSVTITPSSSTALQFSVNASINGLAGSAQTAYGTLTARSTFLAVQDVTATPAFVSPGAPVDVTAHIANVVNQNKTVNVQLVVNNSSNTQVLGPFNQTVTLSVSSLLTTVDFGQIATIGLSNGNYALVVSVIDPSTSMVLPGGTGTGALLIGSPVTATLTAAPITLAPGNGTVTTTLKVSGSNFGSGGTPYSLLGSVMTASPAESVAINGNVAYVCDQNEVSVVDITNPANPTLLGTALAGAISNAAIISCSIRPDTTIPSQMDLVMLVDAANTYTGNSPSFIAFSLADPLNPTLIASTIVEKRFFRAPYYQGNTLFVATGGVYLEGSYITGQFGDFVAIDVSNYSNPTVIGTLEQQTNGSVYGGSYETYGLGAVAANSTTAYLGTSTMTGDNLNGGTGQIWVVDTSNPASMSVIEQVNVPGTTQISAPSVQGNIAVALGNTNGWVDPLPSNGSSALAGNVVVAVLDLANPQAPLVVANITTPYVFGIGGGQTILGTNLFLFGGVSDTMGNQLVMTVDTTNFVNPVITTYPVPAQFNSVVPVGNLLYAPTSDHGFQIYSIPGTGGGVQYTAAVQLPNSGKVIYNPGSFSTPPVITPGVGFDTATFTNPVSNTITWTSAVTGIAPADVLPVALGGTVNFTVSAGSGSITLPQVNINSGQIVGLNPGTQTVAPGQLASYTLIVNNPTTASVTYNLAVTGVNPSWVSLQSSVTVPANGSVNVPLNLRSTLADLAGTYNFMVTATSGGSSGAVEGTMILVGTGSIGSLGSTNALGASVALIPTQQTGGQGTPATFTVQVTNAGNVADTYALSVTAPGGTTASFAQPSLTIQPGLSNFQQTLLQLTAAPGTTPGPLNFTVKATSQTNPQVTSTAAGILNVVSTGVSVTLSPSSVSPGGSFQLTVHNIGQTAGTFAIALGGPAAVIATLASSSVTLNAGQSQTLSVAIGSAPFAALGSLGLVATASANGVTGAAQGSVIIPSSQSVSAAFNPSRTALNAPGPATLLLQVQNAGTTQDTYTATIVSTSGPIAQASIVDTTGQNVQTTSPFILPGVTLGELAVNATLTANNSSGTVTVKIVSQTNPAITALATGILGIGADMPVAIAGKNRNVLTGKYTSLDGGQSFDPGKAPLTYAWTIVSKPALSALTTLINATTPQPDFLPDVNGAYTLQLIVNNGAQSSAPSLVTITAYTVGIPPNANAGAAANAQRGHPVTLNGTLSNDPSGAGATLSYQWVIQAAPAGSLLAGATLAAIATPSFTPDADGAFTIALTVTDTSGSGTDTVIVTAYDDPNAGNVPPNAVAGANRRIVVATPVTVDGSGSNDPDNGPQPLTYQWSFVSSVLPGSSLQNANAPKVTFTPPMAGFYVTRLDLSDGAASSFGEATVMAAGYCDANADGIVNQVDFDLMTALNGTPAQPNDPLDVNSDGVISAADVSLCKARTGIVGGSVVLTMTPAYLNFSYTIGGAAPAAQGFGVSSSSTSPVSALVWSPNAAWLQLSPTSGSTPFTVMASVNPAGLAPGGYQGLIYAASGSAGNTPQVVVTLQVYATPQFILTPPSLTFNYQTGQAPPAPQTLEVASSGKVVSYTSAITPASAASWLSIQPSSGQTPYPSSVTVLPQGMAPGTYNATITFTSAEAGTASEPVTLVVTPAPPVITASNVVNAASLLSGPIAPGEMLNIGGTGFAAAGPAITAPAIQPLPAQLANTQVFFNNIPAPMSSLQSNQVSVVVPYEIQNQSTVLLKVVYAGASSATVNLIVAPTAPGIFTSNSSGVGQITAVNIDATLNSTGNPAARGTPITFYATGGGQTTPAGIDGALAGKTPPVPTAPVSLMIGGVAAQVTYIGGAPGYPAGLLQINAVIPATIDPNVATPIVLTIGTANSQPGVTIATH